MFEEFAESFRFERNGADDEVRFVFETLGNGFELPSVAELGEMLYRRDIRAPTRNAS